LASITHKNHGTQLAQISELSVHTTPVPLRVKTVTEQNRYVVCNFHFWDSAVDLPVGSLKLLVTTLLWI